jgi:transcriptional regulator with XRE-family HTH domain
MINPLEKAPITIGQRIRRAREKASLTQSELATLLGYTSPTAVSLIEADERSVKVETLEKIAQVLHQDVNYLATGNKSEATVKTALRADANFEPEDVKKIESYIDYLMSQKKQNDGRGKTEG